MPTINFTQFPEPTDTIPNNDYVIGYDRVNNVARETRMSAQRFAAEVMPSNGLGTKNFQIRMFAKAIFEPTYSFAAVTKNEEVICWGRNFREEFYASEASGVFPANTPQNQRITKFGAGFACTQKASCWQPVVIPFFLGVVGGTAVNDILDLKAAGLTIVELFWNMRSAIARLSDGSVWVKSALGQAVNNGLGNVDAALTTPTSTFYSSGFFKVEFGNMAVAVDGSSSFRAKRIITLPHPFSDRYDLSQAAQHWGGSPQGIGKDYFGAVDLANDLWLWGDAVATTNPILPSGASSKSPVNVTNGFAGTQQKVLDVTLQGRGSVGSTSDIPARMFSSTTYAAESKNYRGYILGVITTENKLYFKGYGGWGALGNGSLNSNSNWAQANYQNDSLVSTPVDNALRFVESYYQIAVTGYISKPDANNRNAIYFSGNNLFFGDIMPDNYSGATGNAKISPDQNNIVQTLPTPNPANSIFQKRYQANAGEALTKAILTNNLTCVAIDIKGNVWSAGNNAWGECGQAGAAFSTLATTTNNPQRLLTWGQAAFRRVNQESAGSAVTLGLTATDIAFTTATPGHLTDARYTPGQAIGVLVKTTVSGRDKYQWYLSGYRTFTQQNNSYINSARTTFLLYPTRESASSVPGSLHLGSGRTNLDYAAAAAPFNSLPGDSTAVDSRSSHQYTFVLTETGRVYATGFGPWDLIQNSDDGYRGTFNSGTFNWSWSSWVNAWSPTPTVVF